MRRKEREVQDKQEIIAILRRLDTLRIAMQGEEYPYVVPVSFGMEVLDDRPVVYFHCAQQGMKLELLKRNPRVCVEGDRLFCIEKTAHGITARYESVIGFGECEFVRDPEEILHGLRLLTEHYGHDDYPLDRCAGLSHLLIGKIVLNSLTGKQNPPGSLTPADRAAR